MNPILIDLNGLRAQFGLSADNIDELTEICVNSVTALIYSNWEAIAKKTLKSTLPEYTQNLIKVDKGRFAKQIVLTGVLPNMLEQGASAFDMKQGFKNSKKVKYTIPVYGKKGNMLYKGGDWYLTIPFRIGVPGTLGQAGFTQQMPDEIYKAAKGLRSGDSVKKYNIPSLYDVPKSRAAIVNEGKILFDSYRHKNSIYEGLTKRTAQYDKVSQNTYGTFRRAGANSDPLSWIHRGFSGYHLAEKAVEMSDIDTIVNNEVTDYLETIL